MKHTFKLLGIIALAALIGFSITACPSGGGGNGNNTILSGTSWSHYDENHGATEILAFFSTGNSVTLTDPWINISGTYIVAGSNVTINFKSPSAKYTGVISGTTLTITTDRNETQIFQKQ
jgi:hypothetical protein